jgi:hypothetical protein
MIYGPIDRRLPCVHEHRSWSRPCQCRNSYMRRLPNVERLQIFTGARVNRATGQDMIPTHDSDHTSPSALISDDYFSSHKASVRVRTTAHVRPSSCYVAFCTRADTVYFQVQKVSAVELVVQSLHVVYQARSGSLTTQGR